MGGTSTDVAHSDGDYERAFDTEVAGVRIRAPMMRIHTVAAGGGSILHAEPGPLPASDRIPPAPIPAPPAIAAAARSRSPTRTSCSASSSPISFRRSSGPDRTNPSTSSASRRVRRRLARESDDRPGAPRNSPRASSTIAVENMANAIKKISVQRGYDVTRYLLNCFGGAGGQHACLVADALGMEIDPHPSVLRPPFGLRHRACDAVRLPPAGAGQDRSTTGPATPIAETISRLRDEVVDELRAQHVPAGEIDWRSAPASALRRHRHGPTRAISRTVTSPPPAPPSSRPQGPVRLRLRRQADRRRSRRRRSLRCTTAPRRRKPVCERRSSSARTRELRGRCSPEADGTTPASSAASGSRPATAINGPALIIETQPDHRRRAGLAGRDQRARPRPPAPLREEGSASRPSARARPIRSCSRSSTTSSCRSPSRWA